MLLGVCYACHGVPRHQGRDVSSLAFRGPSMCHLQSIDAALFGKQESWELMFDTVDTVHDCIRISTGVISTVKIFPNNMLKGLSPDMLATDLAEYLVRKGEGPFLASC